MKYTDSLSKGLWLFWVFCFCFLLEKTETVVGMKLIWWRGMVWLMRKFHFLVYRRPCLQSFNTSVSPSGETLTSDIATCKQGSGICAGGATTFPSSAVVGGEGWTAPWSSFSDCVDIETRSQCYRGMGFSVRFSLVPYFQ